MTDRPKCPSVEQLQELMLGRLPDPPAAELESHVLDCRQCAERTIELHGGDTLLDAVKLAGRNMPQRKAEEQAKLDRLIGTLSELAKRGAESNTVSNNTFAPGNVTQAASESEEVAREFARSWQPAQAADEMGRVGNYRILKVLGAGGMGGVFLAEDMQLQRHVALKLMHPRITATPGAAERFLREARAAAALKSERVVTIYQVGQDQSVPFLAQELLEGETLDSRLRRDGALPIADVVIIGREIAEGLAAAHAKGLIHRDIKPANVWLESDSFSPPETSTGALAPARFHVKLLDFGLARPVSSVDELTQSGVIVGTPAYLAPEQARGSDIDARADLFGLGCVFFQCLVGKQPFRGNDFLAVLNELATHTPPATKSLRPEIPQPLSELVRKLLAKSRDERPASANEVVKQLSAIAESSLGTKVELAKKDRPPKHWLIAAAIAAACVFFGVIVIKLKDKEGSITKITVDVPEGTKVASVELSPSGKTEPPLETTSNTLVPKAENKPFVTLSQLDPKNIPESERVPGQPAELVSVIGEHRLRHWGQALRVIFHPSGEFFLSSGEHDDSRLWSTQKLEDWTDRLDPGTASSGTSSLFFSPNGQILWRGQKQYAVAIDENKKPSFEQLKDVKIKGEVPQFVTSPDGHWLVGTGRIDTGAMLEIFNVSGATPRFVKEVTFATKGYAKTLLLSGDGRRLMSEGPNSIFLWDVDWSAEAGPTLRPVGEPIIAHCGSMSPDGNVLVAGNQGMPKSKIFDLQQIPPREVQEVAGNWPFAFSPQGRWLATNDNSGVILYEQINNSWMKRFGLDSAKSNLHTITFSPDEKTLVIGDASGYLHVWDLSKSRPVERNPAPQASRVRQAVFSPDGRKLGVQGWDGSTVWNVDGLIPERLTLTQTSGGHGTRLPSFSHDSTLAVLDDQIWDLSFNPARSHPRRDTRDLLRFSPIDRKLATYKYEEKNNAIVYEAWTRTDRGAFRILNPVHTWHPNRPHGGGTAVLLSKLQFQCDRAVMQFEGNKYEVWSIEDDSKPLFDLKFSGNLDYRLSSAGDLLVARSSVECVVWDLKASPPHEVRFRIQSPFVQDSFFTPDSQLLVVAAGTRISIFDWARQTELRRIALPGNIVSLALHPDGQHVATANANGTVYILRIPELAEHNLLKK